jgi:hypothetical protein
MTGDQWRVVKAIAAVVEVRRHVASARRAANRRGVHGERLHDHEIRVAANLDPLRHDRRFNAVLERGCRVGG